MPVLVSQTTQCQMVGWWVNNELYNTLKEAVMAKLEVHLPGRTEENHKKTLSGQCLDQDLNQAPPTYRVRQNDLPVLERK
jgi:hypothetical protein